MSGSPARTVSRWPPRDAAQAAATVVWGHLPGPSLDAGTARLLDAGIGGVVLFAANIESAEQLRRLTAELRALARRPFRVAIDHEGGHVARIGAPLTRFPSAMAIGASGSVELAYQVALAAGRELAWLGIDVVLAPVLDVASDPRNASVGARAFSSSPARVAELGAAMIRGYRDAGIASAAKHFPGHGRTPVDPHHAIAVVAGGPDALSRTDLPPFRAAIAAGVDVVMSTHVTYDGVTRAGEPATLSAAILGRLLRDELGFEGLALTDAMRMRALADVMPVPQGCVAAIAAGADAAMPLEESAAAIDAIRAAVTSGALSGERLEDAVRRARRLDEALEDRARRAGPPLDGMPVPAHGELARTVARRSLTLVHGGPVLPLPPGADVAVVEFPSRRPSPIEETSGATSTLASALGRFLPAVRALSLDEDHGTDPAAADRVAAAAAGADVVVIATRDAYLRPEDRALVARLAAAGRPSILIALRNPYDIAVLARTSAAVAAYADVPATLDALADALTGGAGWPGVMPLDLAASGADAEVSGRTAGVAL